MYKIILFTFFNIIYLSNGQYFSKTNHFKEMKTVYAWDQLGYNFDGVKYKQNSAHQRLIDVVYFEDDPDDKDMFFIQYNNVPVGFEVYNERVFVTVPRRRYGIASTLNVLEDQSGSKAPLLRPYPNTASVSSLVSVYRPRVDECDRLWVVDTGLLELPDKSQRVQMKEPEIIIYNLKTNEEILRHKIKSTSLVNGTTSGLTSITVDVTKTLCDDAYAYITDLATAGLIVFSLREKDTWRFSHNSLMFDDGASDFKIGSRVIDWKDSLFSVALTEPNSQGVRTAYYHPLVATQEFSITTDVLKNKTADFDLNHKLEGVRGVWSQSGSHAYHPETRTLLFANVAQDGVLCWNVDVRLTSKTTALVAQHHKQLIYISDLKVVGDSVWVLANKMPHFIYAKLNTNETNFNIMKGKIVDLIKNTTCEGKKQ